MLEEVFVRPTGVNLGKLKKVDKLSFSIVIYDLQEQPLYRSSSSNFVKEKVPQADVFPSSKQNIMVPSIYFQMKHRMSVVVEFCENEIVVKEMRTDLFDFTNTRDMKTNICKNQTVCFDGSSVTFVLQKSQLQTMMYVITVCNPLLQIGNNCLPISNIPVSNYISVMFSNKHGAYFTYANDSHINLCFENKQDLDTFQIQIILFLPKYQLQFVNLCCIKINLLDLNQKPDINFIKYSFHIRSFTLKYSLMFFIDCLLAASEQEQDYCSFVDCLMQVDINSTLTSYLQSSDIYFGNQVSNGLQSKIRKTVDKITSSRNNQFKQQNQVKQQYQLTFDIFKFSFWMRILELKHEQQNLTAYEKPAVLLSHSESDCLDQQLRKLFISQSGTGLATCNFECPDSFIDIFVLDFLCGQQQSMNFGLTIQYAEMFQIGTNQFSRNYPIIMFNPVITVQLNGTQRIGIAILNQLFVNNVESLPIAQMNYIQHCIFLNYIQINHLSNNNIGNERVKQTLQLGGSKLIFGVFPLDNIKLVEQTELNISSIGRDLASPHDTIFSVELPQIQGSHFILSAVVHDIHQTKIKEAVTFAKLHRGRQRSQLVVDPLFFSRILLKEQELLSSDTVSKEIIQLQSCSDLTIKVFLQQKQQQQFVRTKGQLAAAIVYDSTDESFNGSRYSVVQHILSVLDEQICRTPLNFNDETIQQVKNKRLDEETEYNKLCMEQAKLKAQLLGIKK